MKKWADAQACPISFPVLSHFAKVRTRLFFVSLGGRMIVGKEGEGERRVEGRLFRLR
jgi:hypothetical protein